MIVDVEPDTLVVTKRAETGGEAEQLVREAAALDRARHPSVPHLLAMDTDSAVLRIGPVPGRRLCELEGVNDLQVAGLGAALATILADLHDIGVAHGAVTADHIAIDATGQPMLTGLASGTPSDDLAGLARVLLAALPPDDGDRQGRALRRILAKAGRPDSRPRPTARRLARQLVNRFPAATLVAAAASDGARAAPTSQLAPDQTGQTENQRPGLPAGAGVSGAASRTTQPRPRRSPAAVAGAVAAAGLALIIFFTPRQPPTGRYRIGRPGDRVVVGRWQCREPLAALLRPATGQVWVFDAWAGRDRPIPGRLVARADGAVSIRADPAPANPGCDRLLVNRQSGPPVAVDPNRAD